MKLYEYRIYDTFKTITFENNSGYTVEFTVRADGDISLEAQCVSIEDIEQCIVMIKSGKLEITL